MTPAQWNEYQRQADVIEEAKKWKEEQDKLKQITQLEEIVSRLEEDGLYALQGIKDSVETLKNK
jgi:hypothetical protein